MKTCLALCISFIAFINGYTQPSGAIPLEDIKFDEQFAKGTVPKVTGKLLNLTTEELSKIPITYSLVTLAGQVKKTSQAAADGTFSLELDYALPYQQIWLSVDTVFYTGLYANKDLHLELDMRKIKALGQELQFNGDGVKFLGTDGALNKYMNDYILFRRPEQLALSSRMQRIPRPRNPVASEVEAAYRGVFDSLKMIEDDYIATHPSPYGWLLENERMSDYYGIISVCYWNSAMEDELFNRVKQHTTYLVSNNSTLFYNYLSVYLRATPAIRSRIITNWKDVALLPDLNDAEKAAIDSLRTAAASVSPVYPYTSENTLRWTKQLQPRLQKIRQERMLTTCIRALDSIFPSAKADYMKLWLNDSKDIAEQKYALERLLPGMQTKWCRTIAEKNYAKTLDKIAAVNKALASSGNAIVAADFGKPLHQTDFGASMYKISGVKGADFLASLRKSFAGKAIIFDLWATWCAPCLAEMPHSKKLQQDAKDLPVVFVYVCTAQGSDEDRWKRKVGELNLPGVHFFIDEMLDTELSQYFSFSGYPGYAFIDRNGVYKAGAIKRVSDIKDRAELARLVK